MSPSTAAPGLGTVYVCSLCGAELAVIRGGKGAHKHYCCNVPMDLVDRINLLYVCPVCGSELMAINEVTENLAPICCTRPMGVVNG